MSGLSSKAMAFGTPENKLKYNGKEVQRAEFSDGSGLDWLDYGARMYDGQIGRWMLSDPLSEEYYAVSPYVYVANDPVDLIDPDGREIIGSDGKAISYKRNGDGSITWSENVTTDTRTIGEAMLLTQSGTESFDNWINLKTQVNLILTDKELVDEDGKPTAAFGKTDVLDDNGNVVSFAKQHDKKYLNDKGEYNAVKITVSTHTSEGDRYHKATKLEMINAVASHEEVHTRKEQIALERKPLAGRGGMMGIWHEPAFSQELKSRLEFSILYPSSAQSSSEYIPAYINNTTLSPRDVKKIQQQAIDNAAKYKKYGN